MFKIGFSLCINNVCIYSVLFQIILQALKFLLREKQLHIYCGRIDFSNFHFVPEIEV